MTKSFKRGDKRKVAIELINAYSKSPSKEIIEKIAATLEINQGAAASYFRFCVKNGMTKITSDSLVVIKTAKAPKAPKKALEASSGPKASKPSPDQVQAFKDGLERARVRAELKASVDTQVLDSQVA
jgi:hypothetical protein